MAEEFDIEAMLEAPYCATSVTQQLSHNGHQSSIRNGHSEHRLENKKRTRSRSRSKERSSRNHRRSRSRERKRDRSKERKRDRRRSRSRDRKRRSRSRERRERRRSRSKSPDHRRRSRERRKNSPSREERLLAEADQRTVLCMQLSQRVGQRDLEEFFSSVGKVREVRLIMDIKSRRHKGVAYIEFKDPASVPLALGLSGQKLGGYPIQVQPTQAQKNRPNAVNNTPANPPADPTSHPPTSRRLNPLSNPAFVTSSAVTNPLAVAAKRIPMLTGQARLYVGSLHFNITEEMLKSIFEPFGSIMKVELIRDTETLRSKGYGFVTYADSEDAKKALEQLNGFELAGRPMKVNHANERSVDVATAAAAAILGSATIPNASLDSDEIDRTGVDLNAASRLHLMAKLAEGTGLQVPQPTSNVFMQYTNASGAAISSFESNNLQTSIESIQQNLTIATNDSQTAGANVITKCFLLTNMFDPATEEGNNWDDEIRSDVIEECRNHGGALHVFVDRNSQGNVYVKCPSIETANVCVTALHGRWFSGKLITAAYVPEINYHQLFPDSVDAKNIL